MNESLLHRESHDGACNAPRPHNWREACRRVVNHAGPHHSTDEGGRRPVFWTTERDYLDIGDILGMLDAALAAASPDSAPLAAVIEHTHHLTGGFFGNCPACIAGAASQDSAPAGLDVALLAEAMKAARLVTNDAAWDIWAERTAIEYDRLRANPASTTGPAHEAGKWTDPGNEFGGHDGLPPHRHDGPRDITWLVAGGTADESRWPRTLHDHPEAVR